MPAGSEHALTGLAIKILDGFLATVVAVSDWGVDCGIGDLGIHTIWMGTGVPLGATSFFAKWTTRTFELGIGDNGFGDGWCLSVLQQKGQLSGVRGRRGRGARCLEGGRMGRQSGKWRNRASSTRKTRANPRVSQGSR